MIIGINGKVNSGKDTVAKIVQYLTNPFDRDMKTVFDSKVNYGLNNNYRIKRFADKLKDIVCLLIGCTREELEDREFKEKELGEEWIRYGYASGFKHIYEDGVKTTVMTNTECSKERYEEELKINHQTAYKIELTPRMLLQFIGTDLFRNKILDNIWVNALMSDYKPIDSRTIQDPDDSNINYPKWLIPDVRFPNELKTIKARDGIVIRVNRDSPKEFIYTKKEVYDKLVAMGFKYESIEDTVWYEHAINEGFKFSESLNTWSFDEDNFQKHPSETALDDATFDYVIDNNSTIEELVEKVREILVKLNILQ